MTTAVASLSVAEAVPGVGEREIAHMRRALAAAEQAAGKGEVPVGAIVVVGDEVIAVAHNERETGSDRPHTRRSWRCGAPPRRWAGGG